jgi:hypothetical protein
MRSLVEGSPPHSLETEAAMMTESAVAMSIAIEEPPRKVVRRRKSSSAASRIPNARDLIDTIQEHNGEAQHALDRLRALNVSGTAARRRAEAVIALNHFEAAIDTLRKSLL